MVARFSAMTRDHCEIRQVADRLFQLAMAGGGQILPSSVAGDRPARWITQGDEPALAGERSAVERPLHQSFGKPSIWQAQRCVFRVLQVAGIDRLVFVFGRERRQQGLELVRADRNDDRPEFRQQRGKVADGGVAAQRAAMARQEFAGGLREEAREVHFRQQEIAGTRGPAIESRSTVANTCAEACSGGVLSADTHSGRQT